MSTTNQLSPVAQELITRLRREMIGEVDADVRRRAEYTSDASNYRVVPQVVAFPHDADDTLAALAAARDLEVPVTPRGAGTSCAGNAVGPGLVLDFSRHMARIGEIDVEARTAWVEPGVIMSDLQRAVAPHGLRFGPDPSTMNRATFGGMIGNNACGPRAVAWGRTADNILELDVVDGQGRRFTAGAGAGALDAVPGLEALVSANLAQIRTEFGRFTRQVSGYSFEHLLPENGSDLAKFLVGSEGTLATVLRAKVRLVAVPRRPVLVVLGYPTMPDAADAVPGLLEHRPLAIEGMDRRLVEVVRRAKGDAAIPPLPAGEGWLMVEVGLHEDEAAGLSDDEVAAAALDRAHKLAAAGGTDAFVVMPPGPEADALWRIRSDGAGLGGRTPAGLAAWPGWEDAAVPPAKLGSYLREFEALLAKHGRDGLLYGHFGDGCVHVRIDAPFTEPGGVERWKHFLEEAADLVAAHGGSISGEHGDGRTRSELLSRMYSPDTMHLFGQAKALFDPQNNLNPGIIADADALDVNLRRPYAKPTRAVASETGGFSYPHDGDDFTTAVHRCTGVGKCRADNSAAGGFMCPSYQATKDEKDSTRGRARVLQEAANGSLVAGWADPAVRESLDLCLSCKACSSDCPTGMDMARYRSEVLHRTLAGKLRPLTHYSLGVLPMWTKLLHQVPFAPQLANVVMGVNGIRKLAFAMLGIDTRRAMPKIATERFSKWVKRTHPEALNDGVALRGAGVGRIGEAGGAGEGKPLVVLWADSFSQDLDGSGARACYDVLTAAGYHVVIPPEDACCGLTWISTGQLDGARKRLSNLLDVLAPFAANDIPIVGVEPSCTAVLRDDLLDLIPDDPRFRMVSDATMTLAELLTAPSPIGPGDRWQVPDLSGVELIAQPHCHHHAVMGWRSDAELLDRAGANVTQLAGCCGLAGNFGMEKGHYEISMAVAENALAPALRDAPEGALYLADGFSCRTQAEQVVGTRGIHLAQLLRDGKNARPEGGA